MLKSKLSSIKYPCLTSYSEFLRWLRFAPGVDPYLIDPVFLGRHAAMCKSLGIIDTITSGTRSYDKQVSLYLADGGKQLPNGEWTGGTGYVAKPGSSWHNNGLAIDSSSKAVKMIDKVAAFKAQTTLMKFGLCKPMTSGNGQRVLEDWHIQPIETINITRENRSKLAPEGLDVGDEVNIPVTILRKGDTGENVKLLQLKLKAAGFPCGADGDFGPKVELAVKGFQGKNRVEADGVVGKLTWTLLN